MSDDAIAMSSGFHGDLEEADVSAVRLPEQPCASVTFRTKDTGRS